MSAAPTPARFSQGDAVRLPHGAPATVSAVVPPGARGCWRYFVAEWSPGDEAFDFRVVDEGELSPVGRA